MWVITYANQTIHKYYNFKYKTKKEALKEYNKMIERENKINNLYEIFEKDIKGFKENKDDYLFYDKTYRGYYLLDNLLKINYYEHIIQRLKLINESDVKYFRGELNDKMSNDYFIKDQMMCDKKLPFKINIFVVNTKNYKAEREISFYCYKSYNDVSL